MTFPFLGPGLFSGATSMLVSGRVIHPIWSNYSDLPWPHTKWWFSKGNPHISGKPRLMKYYNLTRSNPDAFLARFLPPSSVRVNRRYRGSWLAKQLTTRMMRHALLAPWQVHCMCDKWPSSTVCQLLGERGETSKILTSRWFKPWPSFLGVKLSDLFRGWWTNIN